MNRRSILLIIFSLGVFAFPAGAQDLSPMQLAQRIFSRKPFPDLKKYCTGEYQGRPNGTDLRGPVTTKFLLLSQSATKAVVAMNVHNQRGQGMDAYLFFERKTRWKMHAFRSLAMTNIIEESLRELERLSPAQVDSMISRDKTKSAEEFITSREDYDFLVGNNRLILQADDSIIAHFVRNKATFNRIRDAALQELKGQNPDGERQISLVANLAGEYRKLFIHKVEFGSFELGGHCLDFSIGGMLDNVVGYIYVSDEKYLPEMDDSRIIMIRKIGDGWYLYKTT